MGLRGAGKLGAGAADLGAGEAGGGAEAELGALAAAHLRGADPEDAVDVDGELDEDHDLAGGRVGQAGADEAAEQAVVADVGRLTLVDVDLDLALAAGGRAHDL